MLPPRAAFALLFALACAGCKEADVAKAAGADRVADGPALSPFPCVHFEDLRRHLPPRLDGYDAVRDEGSVGKYGEVAISEAERVFSSTDGREVSVRIVDTTMVEELGRAIRAAAKDASARPENDPTAPILAAQTIGFVRYDGGQRRAEANLLVADRFVVAVTTRGIEGTQQARSVAESIDVSGLALLR